MSGPSFEDFERDAEAALARNNPDEAMRALEAALSLAPENARIHFNLANLLLGSGDTAGAIRHYKRGLASDPSNYGAHLNLGVALANSGQVDGALAAVTQAASLADVDPGAHINLAAILRMQGRGPEAEGWLRRAKTLPLSTADACFSLGQALFESRSHHEAEQLFLAALAKDPAHLPAGLQLIAVHLNVGDSGKAKEHLDRLTAYHPHDVQVARTALMVSRALADTVGKLRAARQILAREPEDADALREVVRHSDAGDEKDGARAKLQILCRRNPRDVETWKVLAESVSEKGGGYDTSVEIFEEGIALTDDPALRMCRAFHLPRVPLSNAQIDAVRAATERHLDILISRPASTAVNLQKSVNRVPFRLAYHGRNDRSLMEKLARAHLAISPGLAWSSPHLARRRSERNKIRIGFLSAFLEFHSVGKMVRKVIEDLNRAHFEIVILRPVPARDDFARAIDASADSVIVFPLRVEAAREAVAEADLDILFYADIGMEPLSYYLAFARLARRQVVWPGHPVTTGLSTIDAYISGVTAEPENAQEHYTEKLVQFSAVPIYEEARPLKPESAFRSKFGLPEGPLYVCPMAEQKYHPDFDDLLRHVFERDPRANFVMVGRGDGTTQQVHRRLLSNVPGLAGRLFTLRWLNQSEFINLLQTADANLDTPHFSGSGTSRDAATLGAVMVTLEGAYMRGRLTAGMYRDMGFPQLALSTPDAYADLAVRLANDKEFRTRLGAEVRAAAPSLVLRKQILTDFENLFVALMKDI